MILATLLLALSQDGNRLTYLDELDPYYVHRSFPKLTTPQWVGEPGVEAVITLGVDDMRDHQKYETFLRPILDRLRQIDGRSPVSIMTCTIDPNHPQLQKWLREGLSLEIHTVDHPCPLLKDGSFPKAKSTVDRCIDLMNLIPGNKPVAYRMPCCDSLNTCSPRFWAEIFNKTTPHGKFLTIDTSVFNITTSADPDLPKELTTDPDGKERFRKYVPFPSFVNTIENYPYPYVIGGLCWEFPCAVPSDWEAQHLNKPNSPKSVEDMKAAIDAVVIKKGVFNFVFHPHNWIKSEQVVEIIDHVVAKHGSKVKFLTFREAQERLDTAFGPLRKPDGSDSGLRILDLDGDGLLDALKLGEQSIETRTSADGKWVRQELPFSPLGGRFGVVNGTRKATLFCKEGRWTHPDAIGPSAGTLKTSVILRDLDGDGTVEQIADSAIYRLETDGWVKLPLELPVSRLDANGRDNGLRFVDLNGDNLADIVASNERVWGVWLFKDLKTGWEKVSSGKQGDPGSLPLISREGTNNGAWFHSKHLWVQNEDTAKMKDLVDRRSLADLLQKK